MPSHSGRRTFGAYLNEGVAFYFIRLALQLRFSFEMSAAGLGLVSASPD